MVGEDIKSKRAHDVRSKWSTVPIDGNSYCNLLKEYRGYLHSDMCDDKQIIIDVVAVVYKNLIDTFNRILVLS